MDKIIYYIVGTAIVVIIAVFGVRYINDNTEVVIPSESPNISHQETLGDGMETQLIEKVDLAKNLESNGPVRESESEVIETGDVKLFRTENGVNIFDRIDRLNALLVLKQRQCQAINCAVQFTGANYIQSYINGVNKELKEKVNSSEKFMYVK